MELMEEAPVSFNIARNSPLASKLKSSISRKLLHFLGDFADDVLAEYITVLVCNGKDQNQAKYDLEAFLGERSDAFVSWLWARLSHYTHACKDASPSSPDADVVLRSNRSHKVHSHGNASADRLLTKNRHNFQKNSRDAPNDVELSEFTENSKNHLVKLQKDRTGSRKASDIAEKHGADTLRLSAIATERAKCFERADMHKLVKQIVNQNETGMAGKISDFPRRVMALKCLESSSADLEEGFQGRETYAANIPARNPLTTFVDVPCQRQVSRGSVWDRLGKSCEENSFVNDKSVEAHVGNIVNEHYQAQDQPKLVFPALDENFDLNMKHEVHVLDKNPEAHCYSVDMKYKQNASTIVKPYSENNILLKRTYSEISSNSSSFSASLNQHTVDDHIKERSHDAKKLNSSTKAVAPVTFSKMKDVRQKLQEIEEEISKLRSKQLGMSKEEQPTVPSCSGVIEHSVGDANSRTVFVSNVHFAATKEALSSHFATCGLVSDVTFTDNVKGGSAHITFASKDSVETALALNGISFMSRPLKVARKGEETTLPISKPPMSAVKSWKRPQPVPTHEKTGSENPFNLPRVHHHLQWRRSPISAPSETSES